MPGSRNAQNPEREKCLETLRKQATNVEFRRHNRFKSGLDDDDDDEVRSDRTGGRLRAV